MAKTTDSQREKIGMEKTTWNMFLNIWQHIGQRRRKKIYLLISLTIMSSCSEMLSIGAIFPFIGVITEPDKVLALPILSDMVQWLEITSSLDLIFLLSISFAILVVFAGVLRLLLMWASIRLGNAMGTDLGIDIYRKTLYQPYRVHVARGSNEIISSITQKVSAATAVIVSVVTFITSSSLFLAILMSLLLIDPIISLVAATSFSLAYFIIASNTRRRLVQNSRVIAEQQTNVMKSLQEGLGAIRDVLLDGAQEVYSNIYNRAAVELQHANSENSFISQFPRYMIETLAMLLFAFFVLIMSRRPHGLTDVLPVLGVLALGAQRLLPLMQMIYGNWSVIAGSRAALLDVIELLNQKLPETADQPEPLPLIFNHEIKFHQVSFRYEDSTPWVLDKINLVIPKRARIGIIGSTGGGKSTTLDLLMGLLEPTLGQLQVDGQAIDMSNRRAWQCTIAHVPQSIFLSDSTIAENIAFGVMPEKIDRQRVREAAKQAKAHQFIESSLHGYDTFVGERGVRLSGGQRQRIGIARALYKRASILCFDEATSALDNNTEHEVMEAVDGLDANLTLIIIAHRLTTLKNCTHIVQLEGGKIKHIGAYSNILELA